MGPVYTLTLVAWFAPTVFYCSLSADKDLSPSEFFDLLLPKGQKAKKRRESFELAKKGGGAGVKGKGRAAKERKEKDGKKGKEREGKKERVEWWGGVVGAEGVGGTTASVEDLSLRSKEELVAMLQKAWAK